MKKLILPAFLCLAVAFGGCKEKGPRFIYEGEFLKLTETSITDSLRTITIDQIPTVEVNNPTRLRNATPMTEKLWRLALRDVEINMLDTPGGKYFAAGKVFGMTVFTRDISLSGVLGLNRLYPEEMLMSLKHTRDLRLRIGFHVNAGLAVPEIDAPWDEDTTMTQNDFMAKYMTHAITRRTDDVVWLWSAFDLMERNPALADWQWLYETGNACFEQIYEPFFDPSDGLYRGQACFIDIHELTHQTTGYPQHFTNRDCVLVKALSTNSLYYQALKSMATVCEKAGKKEEAKQWDGKAKALRAAIVKELRFPDGTYTYFKDKDGNLEPRREALGTAFAVITGVLEGEDARKCLDGYPVSWAGVQLLYPFYENVEAVYHNNTAWPFVDTFFLWAKEIAEKKDYTDMNAAMLARVTKGGSFREIVDWRTKEPARSHNQLWTAAGFINTCYRAGIVGDKR